VTDSEIQNGINYGPKNYDTSLCTMTNFMTIIKSLP